MLIRAVLATTFLVSFAGLPVSAEVTEAQLKAISISDKVDTPIGELNFFDGVPTDSTISTVYDYLDRMRGVEVFLDNVGAVSMYNVRKGLADAGAEGANKIALFKQLMDSQTSSPPTPRRSTPSPIPTSPRTGRQ